MCESTGNNCAKQHNAAAAAMMFLTVFLTLVETACRQMLLMPVESEVAAFNGSADTGARTAAAALVIQEAYRMYRHRQLVKVSQAVVILYLLQFVTLSIGMYGILLTMQFSSCASALYRQRCSGSVTASCGATSFRSGQPGSESN